MMDIRRIDFYGPLGKIGSLDWSDGVLTFSGDRDESAEAFLESLNEILSTRLHEAYVNGYNDALKEKIN